MTCVHVKLTHDRWIGPKTVTAVITPDMCYRVTLQGRRKKVRRAAASHINSYHLRPPPLRHDFTVNFISTVPSQGLSQRERMHDSFSPLQLHVFHAWWELYQPSHHQPQPAANSINSEHLAANRAHALLEVPIGTVVWRDFTDQQGRIQRCRIEVDDYKTAYWRVRHSDRGREELTGTQVGQGRDTLSTSTQLTFEVSK